MEGPGGQGPEKADVGQNVGEQQHQRRETNAATEQRVRGHHEGSDELGSSDKQEGDQCHGLRASGKYERRDTGAGGGGTLLSQHGSYSGGTCRIPVALQAPGPATEGRDRGREKRGSRKSWRRPLPHFTGKHWPPSPLTSVNIITPRGSELLPSLAAWQQP